MEETESAGKELTEFLIELDQETILRVQKISAHLQCSTTEIVRHTLIQGLLEIENGGLSPHDPTEEHS